MSLPEIIKELAEMIDFALENPDKQQPSLKERMVAKRKSNQMLKESL